MWEKFVDFMKEYDLSRVMEVIRSIDWHAVLTNPIFIGLTLGFLGFTIYKKRLKLLVITLSLIAFVFLVQMVTPQGGEYVPKEKIFMFIGGGIGLAILNVYLFFFHD
ncbi:MAG: hypothetical protein DRG83_02425 [Deltaproteobacteria bacterium]|nr:MAG: hypothetical protein DRG83_02425 [Deltaproteobacteria bacterium]